MDETAKQRRKTFPVTWLETDDGTAYKLGTSNRINTAVVICEVRATGAWDRGDDSLTLGPEEVAVVTAEIERQHEAAEAAAAESDDGSGEEPEEQAEEEGEERCATWPTDVTITAPTFDEIVNTIQILTPKITELTGINFAIAFSSPSLLAAIAVSLVRTSHELPCTPLRTQCLTWPVVPPLPRGCAAVAKRDRFE